MKSKLKLAALVVFLSQETGFAKVSEVFNYGQLSARLAAGKQLRVITDLSACESQSADGSVTPGPEVLGGIDINAFNKYVKTNEDGSRSETIAFSQALLIEHPQHGNAYSYVRWRFFPNGSVEFTSKWVDPVHFVDLEEKQFRCKFGVGKVKGAISVYVSM